MIGLAELMKLSMNFVNVNILCFWNNSIRENISENSFQNISNNENLEKENKNLEIDIYNIMTTKNQKISYNMKSFYYY